MRRGLGLVVVVLVCGCPPPPGKTAPTEKTALSGKTAASGKAAGSGETAASGESGEANGTPLPFRVDTPEVGTATPEPTPVASATPTSELPAGTVVVRPGNLLRPQRKVGIGLVEVRRRPELVAWLAIGIGEMAFRVHLVEGDRLFAGDAAYRLAALSPEGGVHLTPLTRPPNRPAVIAAAPQGRRLKLATMGLYRLTDGRVIGVGNARAARTVGGGSEPRVPVTVYPAGYAKNPVLEYDLHEALRAKQRVRGKVATFVVVGVSPDRPQVRGEVRLRLVQ